MTEYAPHSKDTNPLLHVKFKHFEQRLRCLMSHNCCDAGLRFIQSHPRFSRFLRHARGAASEPIHEISP